MLFVLWCHVIVISVSYVPLCFSRVFISETVAMTFDNIWCRPALKVEYLDATVGQAIKKMKNLKKKFFSLSTFHKFMRLI